MWQDRAMDQWREQRTAQLPRYVKELIAQLADPDQRVWIRRLERATHPVAQGVADWLSSMDGRPWMAIPADGWELIEGSQVVLAAYPEYLGRDPAAMCALAALWAGDDTWRWDKAASRLGPLVMLGAREGRYHGKGMASRQRSFQNAYAAYLPRWEYAPKAGMTDACTSSELNWAPVPDYTEYRAELTFGVVPHRSGGRGIASELAVLLALVEIEDEERPLAAGLTYKAMEGLWMMKAWERVRL